MSDTGVENTEIRTCAPGPWNFIQRRKALNDKYMEDWRKKMKDAPDGITFGQKRKRSAAMEAFLRDVEEDEENRKNGRRVIRRDDDFPKTTTTKVVGGGRGKQPSTLEMCKELAQMQYAKKNASQ